jgi:hypothetical protein
VNGLSTELQAAGHETAERCRRRGRPKAESM